MAVSVALQTSPALPESNQESRLNSKAAAMSNYPSLDSSSSQVSAILMMKVAIASSC